eukprot:gene8435-10014_t
MKRLAAADQDVEMNRVKKCIFSERNDRRIWRTHLANQERAPKDQLATEALCAALTKYIPQSVLRIQYRLQFLLVEHQAAEIANKWTSKAMEVVARRRKRKRSGAALTYTAEEDQLVLEAYLSSSQPAERSAAMNSVAKGLNRTAGSVRGRVRRLLPDQPTPYHTAEVAPRSADAKSKAITDVSSSNDTSDHSDSPNTDSNNNNSSSNEEVNNVGLPYTAADDDVIWEAYKSTFDQTPRLQALKQAAAQLKRSLGGIISRVKYLKKNSPVEPPANASISAHKRHIHCTTNDKPTVTSNPTVSSQPANGNGPAKSRSGCEYTEEEDMAIWEAYFSTTEGQERKEALRAVATQFGRKYGGVRTHLQSMLDQQTREPDDASDNSDSASNEDNSKDPSCAGTCAATAVEHASGAEHSSTVLTRSAANAKDLAHTLMLHNAQERAFTTATVTDTRSPVHIAPLPITLLTSVLQVPAIPTIPPLQLPVVPIPVSTPPACNNSQDQDDEEDLTSADASNDDPRLVKFLKKLKRNDTTVLLPLEVHDQLMCIVFGCLQYVHQHCASYVSSQDLRKLFVHVKEDLVSTYSRLKDVSNRKFYFLRNLLIKAGCIYVERNQFMHTTFRLSAVVQDIGDMRRRHDRYLCSLMTEAHAYLQNVLCWPIAKAGKEEWFAEVRPVLRDVKNSLQKLSSEPEFSYLSEA